MHLLSAGVAEFITQLCHEDPENAEMSDPKVYSKITKDPTEVSLTVVIETMTRETNYSTMSEHYEPNYNVTTLNTIWHGRCLKVEIQSNVSFKNVESENSNSSSNAFVISAV